MYIQGDRVVSSPSDLKTASECEFAFLRALDVKLGRAEALETADDPMYRRTSALGDAHELRMLERYREQFGSSVVEIERPDLRDPAAVVVAVEGTLGGFAAGADVVFQATFVDDDFVGFADFIVRTADGRYRVQDTKLARSAKVTALLQLAAYADRLRRAGIPVADEVDLLLGDGSISTHLLADILPVYRKRRQRLDTIIAERLAETEPLVWGDPRYAVCGRCEVCVAEIDASRDVFLVAGMRILQRERLHAAGIATIEQLAASTGAVENITAETLGKLRSQARLQLAASPGQPPPVEVYAAEALTALPEPSPGDLYFDFEGDPLYTEGAGTSWGIDYLFGFVDRSETFTAYWAHSFADERVALRRFLDDVAERRAADPKLHIYHYASYERTHLLSIAARHGIGVDEIDALLRDGVLVDLYPLVRRTVRVGSPSYSIKKLEPLYMGDELRSGEVTNAAASIVEYADARALIASGKVAEGEHKLAEIGDYNRYDCVSTLRLHEWLLDKARAAAVVLRGAVEEATPTPAASPLYAELMALAGDPLDAARSPERTALAFAAATLDFHRREQKSFWWEHFARLLYPIDDWAGQKGVLRVDRAEVVRDWYRDPGQRVDRRRLRLHGELAAGGSLKLGSRPYLVYDFDASVVGPKDREDQRHYHSATVSTEYDGITVEFDETLPRGVEAFDDLPIAATPEAPPQAGKQQDAITEWAQSVLDAQPVWPNDPAADIFLRRPPRTRSGSLVTGETLPAVIASILDLDDSYLAVQGPPGTGKTYLGSHVIRTLVAEHGWKIGVVAQSHAVVDNLLTAVVRAGLSPALVGKKPRTGEPESPDYVPLNADGYLAFAEENPGGFVIGGTAWDFANADRVPRGSLDLLVIDEAGQFSLAYTVASAVAARNLLMLGDPQQLPQVSQGIHPEPVDRSALGWIAAGHDVLPAEFGYFLAESRRMHPAVADAVSTLSYEGALRSHPVALTRRLDGVEPGVHPLPVAHVGNANASPEEAAVVVELVRRHLGLGWSDPTPGRPESTIVESDIIVVTPYNAQLELIREALDAAGWPEVRVGTVDKFQGQEAAISIVSLAASSAADVPRGMGFLLQKNRLNVAISRAKWASYLVYSPALLDDLPHTPAGVAELSRFIALVEPAAA
ncbi:TM0106 family RecB-like putative nuclease [Microbacteriaceae bacterium VKM Ac-2855]|nr:TM0106 family RecB-like putative nuclease [Microbacteriaceae bacterium VKM Ac-2855]